jgi:hypothetical protein
MIWPYPRLLHWLSFSEVFSEHFVFVTKILSCRSATESGKIAAESGKQLLKKAKPVCGMLFGNSAKVKN